MTKSGPLEGRAAVASTTTSFRTGGECHPESPQSQLLASSRDAKTIIAHCRTTVASVSPRDGRPTPGRSVAGRLSLRAWLASVAVSRRLGRWSRVPRDGCAVRANLLRVLPEPGSGVGTLV